MRLPRRCRRFFSGEKWAICSIGRLGVAGEHRGGEGGDVAGVVLVIGVGVDDDIGAVVQAGREAAAEGAREAEIAAVADDVIDAVALCDLHGLVGAAVVDDEPFDALEAGHLAGQGVEGEAERGGLVVAGDLDDQLHGRRLAAGPRAGADLGDDGRCLEPRGDALDVGLGLRIRRDAAMPANGAFAGVVAGQR